jgi:hypothetical protein
MDGDKIGIDIPGASEAEIRRGLAAAQRVFDGAGVTAYTAAMASFMRDVLDDMHVLAWQAEIYRLREDDGDEAAALAEEAELARYMEALNIEDMTEAQWAISGLWDEADRAAAEACCAGWTEVPDTAGLHLLAALEAEREALAAAGPA